MRYYLTKTERDAIMESLNESQCLYLREVVKRGKRTIFANRLAKDKGSVITPDMSLETIESLIGEWRLVDYIDGGPFYKERKPPLKCLCGKTLRHQYVIEHKSTGEVRHFGITHFEEHTGFPPKVIHDIASGFEQIDYELDELLTKIKNGWQLNVSFPEGFFLPDEILEYIKNGLPILDRHILKLEEQIHAFNFAKKRTHSQVDRPKSVPNRKRSHIDSRFVLAINRYLLHGTVSAKEISVNLTKYDGYPNERFGKHLEIYDNVVIYLDMLCSQGKCRCISKQNEDVIYKIIK